MTDDAPKIRVRNNGPYLVSGGIPLVLKTPVVSTQGEPLTWEKERVLSADASYALCRCGLSGNKPFCDGTHRQEGFDGTETAPTGPAADREARYKGTGIVVNDDRSLCVHAGFCGNQITNVWKMIEDTDDPSVRDRVRSMVEQCPSGALSYSLGPEAEAVEPDMPREVAVTPDGPLWISGGVPLERSDGQPFETRNRVTLCRCGASKNKPLCDGTHRDVGFKGG